MISNKSIIFGGLCFVTGAAAGFLASYAFAKKHFEEEKKAILEEKGLESISPKKMEKSPDAIKDAKKANETNELKPNQYVKTEADYKQYNNIVKSYATDEKPQEEVHFEEGDVTDITEEEKEYQREKGDKVEILGETEYDPDWPDKEPYEVEELYYFINEDRLVAEPGDNVDVEDTIGAANLEIIKTHPKLSWVRNNPKEIDYHVTLVNESYDSWFVE